MTCEPSVRSTYYRNSLATSYSSSISGSTIIYSGEVELLAAGIGPVLRTIRQQWQLSLREVEERSLCFARERGNQSFQVSASWLDRLEREEHELTVNKLLVLAHIYGVSPEQLLRPQSPADIRPVLLKQPPGPDPAVMFMEGPLQEQAIYLLQDELDQGQPPDETALLSLKKGSLPTHYRRGIIGKRDRTLDPMIPAGSIVHIDTQKRAISSEKDCTHECQRPIYFLKTRDAYVCGWCELDRKSEWLTVIPHPLSPAPSRRWKYQTEIQSLGRVVVVAIRLSE